MMSSCPCTRRSWRCCARTWASQGRSTAASSGSAARAPSSWTGRPCSRAWRSPSTWPARRSRRSKAWRRAGASIPSSRRLPSSAPPSAATARRASFSRRRRSWPTGRAPRARRSGRRSRATCAGAPGIRRSSTPSSWPPCGSEFHDERGPARLLRGKARVHGHRATPPEDRRLGEGDRRDQVRRRPLPPAHGIRQAPPLAARPRPRRARRHRARAGAARCVRRHHRCRPPARQVRNPPRLAGRGGALHQKVRMVGDAVAAVAAVDEETAERACRLIDVEYEPLPALMSIEESLAHPEVRIHEYGDGPNVHKNVSLQFGDIEAAFARADLVREDVFFFEGNTHLPMEQHAAVAQWGADGKLTLWSSTQTPHYVHRLLAKILDMPAAHIRVIAAPVGGGFGGKLDPFAHEIAACRLSQLTGRPVKIACTREEVFYIHRGRHPVLMWIKTGFTRNGDITGCHLRTWLDGGAYGSYGVASTFYTGVINPVTYKMPVYKFEAARIFTNKPPCGPKRGHSTPQPRFALECQLDKAAEQLGLDPAEMRRRIVAEPFSKTANHLTITTIGLSECIDKVVEASGWREKRARSGVQLEPSSPKKSGIGIACSAYLTGAGTAIYWNDMPHSGVITRADRGGGVAVLCGATDIGQGSDSVLAYLTAEVLGIEPKDVHVHPADTSLTPVDLGSYSSRVTLMCGMAAIQASQRLREVIAQAVARKLAVEPGALAFRDRKVGVAADWERAVDFPQAVELAEAMHGVLAFAGSYAPPRRAGKYKGGGVGPSP